MRKWRLGVSSTDEAPETAPLLLKGSITENLEEAARLGYQGIEVHTREDVELDYEAIWSCMEKTGVRIAQIVTGRLNTEGMCSLMDDRPYVTAAAMEGMRRYIDMASKLQAGIVLGWVKGNVPQGKKPGKYMERLARNLQILNAYGREKQVPINIEIINHYEVNVFTTAKSLAEFLEKYGLDNCYIHLDTYHMNLEESNFAEAIRESKGKLGYFHIADNQRWYPGSGQLDFMPILEALEDIGYDGYITVECFPRGNGVDTAEKAALYLNSLMQ